jgi:hypothetical protein
MRWYSWGQAIQVLVGREPKPGDLGGIFADGPPYPDIRSKPLLSLLADGRAEVQGVPFDGQVHQPIPADAWRRIAIEIRSGIPYAANDEEFGIVAVLPPGMPGATKTAGGGWHHLEISEAELAKLQTAATGLLSSKTPDSMAESMAAPPSGLGARRRGPTMAKFRGYDEQDHGIASRVLKMMADGGYLSGWAALRAIPDDELPGTGTPDSRRKRIHRKIPKTGNG